MGEFEHGDRVLVTGPDGVETDGHIEDFRGEAVLTTDLGTRYLRVYQNLGYVVRRA